MNIKEIKKELSNYPDYRYNQVKKALFTRGVNNWDEVTALPEDLRRRLKNKHPLEFNANCLTSTDQKTLKAAIKLKDGLEVETVLMKHDEDRNTVCVSTQVGCALGCKFCATGKMGLKRDLNSEEIINQVYYFLTKLPEGERVDNIVFMGMGEPFLNYENVLETINILNDENGFNIGARNISVSTAGIPEKIKAFANENLQINLAISLHAADDKTRSSLMPINKKYSLKELFKAIDYYTETTNRKVMYEYIPFSGLNDKKEDIDNLVKLLLNRMHFINIIPYNPTGSLTGVTEEKLQKFKNKLRQRGLNAGIRRSFGQDIKGACGQLATES
ncbi:MAG: 23S rRNA (adenine(2503)-C(2))-methyltransferase RlmN [Patescibacteria group bacterium]